MSAPALEMSRIIAEVPTHGDFPATARVIERLRVAVRREDCAALDVARIILADPGTASKVLRLVNSAFYRKGGEPISTISRAVIVLGFEAIRDLTTGLLLVEELLRQGRSSPLVRERLRRALHTALLAQRLAPAAGHPSSEEAYLLGLFSDWGTLWLATYHRPAFERALAVAREHDVALADAMREVFGDGPDELAAAILERWDFPAAFADHFRHPAADEATALASPATRLSALVHVAADWACALEDGADDAAIMGRCERLFGLPPEQLRATAESAAAALGEQAQLLGLARPTARPPVPRPVAPRPEPAAHATAEDTLGLVAEITRSIAEQRDINQVLLMVLEALARTGPFDVVFLVLLTPARDRLVGRLGYGAGVEDALARLVAPVRPGAGLLADTIATRTPHVVPDVAGGSRLVPELASCGIGLSSVIACPLVVRTKAVGVLVAGRTSGPPVHDADLPTVELFCNQAAVALHQYAR